jgi:hypothetical protein
MPPEAFEQGAELCRVGSDQRCLRDKRVGEVRKNLEGGRRIEALYVAFNGSSNQVAPACRLVRRWYAANELVDLHHNSDGLVIVVG